jgi:hypothetical protein
MRTLNDLIQELKELEVFMNPDDTQFCTLVDFANPVDIKWLEKNEMLHIEFKKDKEILLKVGKSHAIDYMRVSDDFKRYLDSGIVKEIQKIFFMISLGWVTFKDQEKCIALESAIAGLK